LNTPPKGHSPGRAHSIEQVARAFEQQGFEVSGKLAAKVSQRLGLPAILSADNARLRPAHWDGDVLSFSVYPSAAMATRAGECFNGSDYLRKGNVEIWSKLAASPKVTALARRALATRQRSAARDGRRVRDHRDHDA
jgi:hypothetical protein